MLPEKETSQLLCVSGNLLPNRGVPLPNMVWVRCTNLAYPVNAHDRYM